MLPNSGFTMHTMALSIVRKLVALKLGKFSNLQNHQIKFHASFSPYTLHSYRSKIVLSLKPKLSGSL